MTYELEDPADHILNWAENSQPHWRRLKEIAVPGNFQRESGRALAAFNLALRTVDDMVRGGDISRNEYSAADILKAASLILEWMPE